MEGEEKGGKSSIGLATLGRGKKDLLDRKKK